ncbi:ABC transporter ATP-binding protein [Oxyplasma meridianum]|uniref:ABC transporter ATP-binding protein n=1 Tax=Oxyplasma meridianum TaxID=3073602 RepID=A0AAX4NFR6_9ARCH
MYDYGESGICIEMKEVTKKYDSISALNGIDMEIPCGARYSLIGPNGAGKSTTLKILVGLLKPDSGKVTVGGFDPVTNQAKGIIGYLPEDAYPYINLTLKENLEYIGAIRGVEDPKSRAMDLIEKLDLLPYRYTKVSQLSRGNRQKLSVALAIVHHPKVILLDEPLNYLDIPTQASVIKMLDDLKATYLVSTHIMEIAEKLSRNVIIIGHGRVTWNGTMDHLRKMAENGERIEEVVARLMKDVA